jgi:hypothetical protein
MKTDELIRLMSSDQQPASAPLERMLALGVAAGMVVSAVCFWATLGPRPDIATVAATARFLLKIVPCLALAAAAVAVVIRSMRPDAQPRQAVLALAIAPALLACAVAAELMVLPQVSWKTAMIGNNAMICITAIPLLSLPPLAAGLWAARQGATTRPVFTGAIAGMLAGGLAAALYATHCTDDSPLFVAVWYSLAIGAVAAAGALAGRVVLRW